MGEEEEWNILDGEEAGRGRREGRSSQERDRTPLIMSPCRGNRAGMAAYNDMASSTNAKPRNTIDNIKLLFGYGNS